MHKGTYRSVAMVILLTLFTCGIYYFYFIYKVSEELQLTLNDPEINPALDVVLCIFTCGIYNLYWFYKTGKKIMQAQQMANIYAEDNSILYLVLALFGLSIVSFGIIQSQLNRLWESDGSSAY